ncbi:kinesin-like protein KIN-7I [Orussus abietinus]|uniref:kinesin-like protein KIN-7I n=1 Tax=Orussus abietinus TaxID=222816 RepID=UPI000625C164|nr:kinesin-like protein KIN-7I [Orussus abietinus]
MSDSIQVAIKVRPLIKREKEDNLQIQWTIQGNSILPADPELRKRGEGGFHFDHIFDMNSTNIDVFNTVTKPIVEAAVNGFNGTIFAYGQTSSGKTYTMMGTEQEPGILPLAIEYMFQLITNSCGLEFLLRVSYIEIYNEKVNDLLKKDGIDLKLHEDINGQVYMHCKEEVIQTEDDVLKHMKRGDKNRRIDVTNMNERSSRSHTIFRITIESREANADSDCAVKVSQLNLVDLAGSERARQTGATGERFKEGKHINMSLSALGLVIKQLSDSQEGPKYINFRDSKLTRILQNSLGGNAMTSIICAVTPVAFDETQCTLAFASRAKSIKNQPHLNEVVSDAALLKRIKKQMSMLMAELQASKQKSAEVEQMETRLQEKDRVNQILEERLELLKSRIVSGNNLQHDEDLKAELKRRRTWGGPDNIVSLRPPRLLASIKECIGDESQEKLEKKQQIKRRQSIIQTSGKDLIKENFQTAFTDFELELIESEREKNRYSSNSVDFEETPIIQVPKHNSKQRVKFMDKVSVSRVSYENCWDDYTPEKRISSSPNISENGSPSTPKNVLRDRIRYLTEEFYTLQEFTTLEKQLLTAGYTSEEKEYIDGLKQSLSDTETVYLDLNKKYSEIQTEHAKLKEAHETTLNECEKLKQEVRSLSDFQEQYHVIKAEKNKLEISANEASDRVKDLMNKNSDYLYQMDFLKTKHKTRVQELESSLQDIEKLEKTILLLTSENKKLFDNLTAEKNHSEEEGVKLQNQIEELNSRLSKVTEEKADLENDLIICRGELEVFQVSSSTINDEEIERKLERYEKKIEQLTEENNELSSDLIDKIEELDKIKESKALLYDHDCTFKEKVESLLEKISCMKNESDELLNNLTEKNEECDNLREMNVLLKSKLEVLTRPTTPENSGDPVLKELTTENMNLKTETAELKTKVTLLSEENEKLSNSLLFIDDIETVRQNVSLDNSLHLSIFDDCSPPDFGAKEASGGNIESLTSEIKTLRDQNNHITRLNEKLSSLKLGSCTQCKHLKEIVQSRRMLKIENRNLYNKLNILQRKFDCANISQNKITEDLDISDSAMNTSNLEGLNVSLVEKQVETLKSQLQTLKEDNETQTELYEEECEELGKSRQSDEKSSLISGTGPCQRQDGIKNIQETVERLEEELQELKKVNAIAGEEYQKLLTEKANMLNEIESLKTYREQLDNEKVKMIDDEMINLNNEIERLNILQNEATKQKVNLEVEVEKLRAEKEGNEKTIDDLRKSISELQEKNCALLKEANEIKQDEKAANEQLVSVNGTAEEVAADLGKLEEENSTQEHTELRSKYQSLSSELVDAKEFIVKELRSFKSDFNEQSLSSVSIQELFRIFLQAIMLKEHEVIRMIQERFEKDRRKLEDQTRQSEDSEKRVAAWAKELEADVERLQNDLLRQESINSELCTEMEGLKHVLKENQYESQSLKEKIEVLESDFGTLQSVVEKQSKKESQDDETAQEDRKKQHFALECIKNREKELETQMKLDKDEYNTKLAELTNSLEAYKSKNMELRNNVEALEALEEHLKNTISRNVNELTCSTQKIQNLEAELEQLKSAYDQLLNEIQEKDRRIEEMTDLLKQNRDTLCELTTKLEVIIPENEILKQQLLDRKQVVDQLKVEMEKRKEDDSKRIESITERLEAEELKVVGLKQQVLNLNEKNAVLNSEVELLKELKVVDLEQQVLDLSEKNTALNLELKLLKELQVVDLEQHVHDLREKNTALDSELKLLKGTCEELEKENEKLTKKVRNENNISQDVVKGLQDEVASLHRELERASSLIKELQESKNQLISDKHELRGKYEILNQEKIQLAEEMNTYKTNHASDLIKLRVNLLQEQQSTVVELEKIKQALQLKEEEMRKYEVEMEELRTKNKELDEEMDEMVKHINSLERENLELNDKLIAPESGYGPMLKLEGTISALKIENKKLKARLPPNALSPNSYEKKIERYKKQNNDLFVRIETIEKKAIMEAQELQSKIVELERKLEAKNSSGSRSISPAYENNRRKQRRSDLFNRMRQIENLGSDDEVFEQRPCQQCSILMEKIRQLELEIVSKNGQIATLEIRFQSENFPYQKKCKEMEDDLLLFRSKNIELKKDVKRLQHALFDITTRECKVCKEKKMNKRDQSTQCLSDCKIFLSGTSSGIIEEHIKIERLMKEKSLMRELCRSRSRRIKELEQRVRELENERSNC